MKPRWLWLVAVGGPALGGALVVLLGPDATASWIVVVLGWPLTSLFGGAAIWSTLSLPRVVKLVAAVATAVALFFVVPIVFFASYVLAVILFGDDDTVYF